MGLGINATARTCAGCTFEIDRAIRGVTPALSARRRPLHRRLSESEKPTASPQRSPETRKQVSRLFRRCDLFDWTSSRICLRISTNAAAMSQCAALTFCGSSSRTRPSRPRASAHSRASVCGSRGRGRGAGLNPGSHPAGIGRFTRRASGSETSTPVASILRARGSIQRLRYDLTEPHEIGLAR